MGQGAKDILGALSLMVGLVLLSTMWLMHSMHVKDIELFLASGIGGVICLLMFVGLVKPHRMFKSENRDSSNYYSRGR